MSAGHASRSEFGALLRQHRSASGLTQEELADKSGLSVRAIANMEQGRTTRPYRDSVRRIADALSLPAPEREQLAQAARSGTIRTGLTPGQFEHGRPAPGQSPPGQPAGQAQSPMVAPRELPATTPYFAGRSDELRALTALLDGAAGASGTVVISAIAGTAGVGKTALAVHWAHHVAGRFPDGQLYVNLRGYDPGRPMPAADALAGFLRALGVAGHDIPAETDERSARYRSLLAGRRMLVVLDNAGQAEQVRPLLPGTSGCVAVVTSRDSLAGLVARDGARRLDLDLLAMADAVSLLRELIGIRADADPEATAALAAQCARLPLALRVAAELAVGRPAVPLATLVAELADQERRLDFLHAGGDSRTAVRAVFSWSYRQLDADAARAFRLAGLHPGPDLDVYAAAALTGRTTDQADHMLSLLTRAHLIQAAGPGRYGMHDLLRAYARELAAGQEAAQEQRAALTGLFDHYLHTAATAMDTLYPAENDRRPRIPTPATAAPPLTDPDAALAWLDTQRPTLAAVAVYAAENGWPGHATRLAATLFRYLDAGGHSPQAITIHTCARRAARGAGDSAAEAQALNSLGVVAGRQGRHQEATGHFQQALDLYREAGDRDGEARALGNLGVIATRQGHYRQATRHGEQALTVARQTGDRFGEAHALGNLGNIHQLQGRYQEASSYIEQALDLFRQTGDRTGEAYALANLGDVNRRQGRYQEATSHLEQALDLFRQTGDRNGEAHALASLGLADLRQGRYQVAAGHLRQALDLFRETLERTGEAEALNGLGEVLLATGRPGKARVRHAAALSLATQIGDQDEQARAHDGLARGHHATGDPARARHHWQQALALYTDLGAPEADQVRARLAASGSQDHRQP